MSTPNQLEPFFFGPPDHQLYGCYHEPGLWPAREQAVLICYPFGQEYIRAHRACQHLASKLAAAGFPTLRFDYFGTGDSCGDGDEATLETWLDDIDRACDELLNRSGATSIMLVGLRLGATLALQAASRRSDLSGLVLWEPVWNGTDYLVELQKSHAEVLAKFFVAPTDVDVRGTTRPTELLGFAVGETLLNELAQIDLGNARAPRGRRVMVVDNAETPTLAAAESGLGKPTMISYQHVPSFPAWADDVDKGLVPHAVIEAIAAWLQNTSEALA